MSLSSEEGIVRFFEKNRNKLSSDIDNFSNAVSSLQNTLKNNPDISVTDSKLFEILEVLSTQTFKAIGDIMDIMQVAFLQLVQLRNGLESRHKSNTD